MEVRYSPDPVRFPRMTTQEVRDNFLVHSLFRTNEIEMVYSDVDRAIVGSAVPAGQTLSLASADELRQIILSASRVGYSQHWTGWYRHYRPPRV